MGDRCFALVIMTTLIPLYANAKAAISEEDRWVVAEKISTIKSNLFIMIQRIL